MLDCCRHWIVFHLYFPIRIFLITFRHLMDIELLQLTEALVGERHLFSGLVVVGVHPGVFSEFFSDRIVDPYTVAAGIITGRS